MNRLIQDIRFALRQLRKAPGFTITAILTLALGIGANAAIFTLVHAVLLRNLPVADPTTLVRIGDRDDCCVNGGVPDDNDYSIFASELYQHLRDNTPEFEQLAAVQAGIWKGNLTARSKGASSLPKPASGEMVTGNYFDVLGLKPFAGRLLMPSDDKPGAPMGAVMSYQAWQRDYNSDPSVVGSTFILNTYPVTIIGITPPAFYGDRMTDSPPDFYIPMVLEPQFGPAHPTSLLHGRGSNWLYLLGRVKPHTDLAQLQAKVSGSLRNYLATLPLYQKKDLNKSLMESHVVLTPGGAGIANMQQQFGKGLRLLMTVSGLVLLIACANIANLVLVRGMARRAETSIRMALGAQRKRLIRQMLTESVLLSCLGGFAGLVVAYIGTRLLLVMAFPRSTDLPIDANPSLPVLGFAFLISLLTGLLFGVAPAWITSHAQPAEALRGSNRTTSDRSGIVQRSLVILQAALSLVLLVGAGLMAKSLMRLENQNFGVITDNRYVVHVSPENAGLKQDQLQGVYDQIEQNLKQIPGVEKVSLSLYTPLEGNNWGEGVFLQGRPEPRMGDQVGASWLRVSPDYFDIVGHHIVRGRGVTIHDTATSAPVVVVNQAFVKKFFPNGQEPLGAHFGVSGMESVGDWEIVGVVSDVKYNNLRNPVRPMYFRPLLQVAHTSPEGDVRSLYVGAIMIQTKGRVDGLESQVRHTLANINPNLTVVRFMTFGEQIRAQFDQERLLAQLTLMFGILALILASVGLYGVTAYSVAKRTPEIGVRMALGASRGSVVSMVLREAMMQAGIGLAIGIPVAWMCARFVQSQLYGVGGHDAIVLGGAVLTLTLAASLAGLIPAQRAASTDPVKALRTE
ncbi:MAG: ABC transporter permease [Edaphobacter sp.]|uniref:ABC transporter permease n=1 Tax=Edaphobacter sp. TaxID=1934404 RepID=UPI0023950408|nr:ABC transporter permease [Edaphobacter sp.]MDE1175805.1 ABC transporter permease [Edaphobacter sp.]